MTEPYRTIVADPPWEYGKTSAQRWREGLPSGETRPMLNYPTMTVAEITALPVGSWAAADAHLYCWATQRYLRDAITIVEAWGFEYRKLLTWAKRPFGFSLGGAWGSASEFVVVAGRGSLAYTGKVPRDWWSWPRPLYSRDGSRGGGHSVKPEAFLDLVEQLSPGPYLELFSRRERFGWAAWGDEALEPVEL